MVVERDPGRGESAQLALGVLGFLLAWPISFALAYLAWPWAPFLGAVPALGALLHRSTRSFGLGLAVGTALAVAVLLASFHDEVDSSALLRR